VRNFISNKAPQCGALLEDHAKEKSDKDLPEYIPIKLLHAACKGNE